VPRRLRFCRVGAAVLRPDMVVMNVEGWVGGSLNTALKGRARLQGGEGLVGGKTHGSGGASPAPTNPDAAIWIEGQGG
jgi:hypothetical protein